MSERHRILAQGNLRILVPLRILLIHENNWRKAPSNSTTDGSFIDHSVLFGWNISDDGEE